MQWLVLALLPGAIVQTAVYGYGTLQSIALCVLACLATEATFLYGRQRATLAQLRASLGSGSVALTALLLGLALPAHAAWWLPLVAGALAIGIGKQLLGQGGSSPYNPAMVGLALLFLLVPEQMTRWHPVLDGYSSATLLDEVRSGLRMARTVDEIRAGRGLFEQGEAWINLAFLAGGLGLLRLKQLPWQIPLGVLGGVAVPALLLWAGDTSRHPSPLFDLLSGSTMLAAFFIATAPPSSPRLPSARLLYGASIGAGLYAIRSWGAYPDGVAFAVLLLNAAAPALDRWAQSSSSTPTRAPTWRHLALALLIAAIAGSVSGLLHHQRIDALPDLATLGLGEGVVGAAAVIQDDALGNFREYELTRNGSRVAVLLRTSAPGYAGDIDVLTAIRPGGRIDSVRVLHHDETRDIGDRIEAARDPWILGFANRSVDEARIDQLSGATVSAHAVGSAVQRSVEYFAAHHDNRPVP